MPGLLIKDVPADIHQSLRTRAKAHRRSISREALTILEEALADRPGPPPLEEIDRRRVQGRKLLTQALLDEARDTGRP